MMEKTENVIVTVIVVVIGLEESLKMLYNLYAVCVVRSFGLVPTLP